MQTENMLYSLITFLSESTGVIMQEITEWKNV